MRVLTAGSQRRVDSVLAALNAAVLLVATAMLPAGEAEPRPLDPVGYLLLVGAALALAVRRRWPVGVAAAAVAAFILYHGRGYPGPVAAVVPAAVALYTAVSLGYRWHALTAMVALCLGKLAGGWVLTGGPLHSLPSVLWVSGWLSVILVWGEVSRHRSAYVHEVEQRALDAERTREEAARRRADEERLRIARELHDTLTHAISVVNVQSSVALHLLRRKPELVEPALLAIREASHEAMSELRATLGVLRAADDARPPGLARLPALAARFEESGLSVITYHRTHLDLRIDDDGPGAPAPIAEGHGLRGMRERAAALGGSLTAGPRPGGGFRVHAILPLPIEAAT